MFRKYFILILWFVICRSAVAADPANAFLDDVQQRGFRYFWEEADPATGLIPDRAGADGQQHFPLCSIASVGFGLTAICVADHRHWVTPDAAYRRVLTTLRFLHDRLPNEHGFFYHFVDLRTGERRWDSEVSSLDTALLMAGVLTVREYYPDSEAARLATELYQRVDWPWMLNNGKTFSMGWRPESGFLATRWDDYSEHMILDLLAIGSPTHPVPPETWQAWRRTSVTSYAGRVFLRCPALFTYQYSHAWVDFRDKRDAYADYWRNSVLATEAHRQFCIDLQSQFPKYSEQLWGVTASDGPDGYKAWGGPPATSQPGIDGTIVPCAAGGSIPFAPQECLAALQYMRQTYGRLIWKRYGFVDAFNPNTGWTDADVIGIDVGITLVMAENYRSGFVWEQFMKNPEIQRALRLAGFHNTGPSLPTADHDYLVQLSRDTWRCIDALIEPATGLPYDNQRRDEDTSMGNIGLYLTDVVAARDMHLITGREAQRRVSRVLERLDTLRHGPSLPLGWISVRTLEPSPEDHWISANETADLEAGLITVGQAFPQLHNQCARLVAAVDWSPFYDQKQKRFDGWLNNSAGKRQPATPLNPLGVDERLASFFAIASGRVPAELWDGLGRRFEEQHPTRYLTAAEVGGDLFMQYQDGLWLDDHGTVMGLSASNTTFAQLTQALVSGLPAWGWSVAATALAQPQAAATRAEENVIQPDACVLALQDYPGEVVANLRALEKLGARNSHWGFVASIDLKAQKIDDVFKIHNQSLVFLSLANYLQGDDIQRWFQADPLVQQGRQLVGDYRQPAYGPNVAILNPVPLPADLRLVPQKTVVAHRFNNWQNVEWQAMDARNALESGVAGDTAAQFSFAWDETALHFKMKVHQSAVVNDCEPSQLFNQDCVELYVARPDTGLRWGNQADCQFGFAVGDKSWEWFGKNRKFQATVKKCADGYIVDADIPWQTIGMTPVAGQFIQVSPAVRNVSDSHGATKLNWNWQPLGAAVQLGRLKFE